MKRKSEYFTKKIMVFLLFVSLLAGMCTGLGGCGKEDGAGWLVMGGKKSDQQKTVGQDVAEQDGSAQEDEDFPTEPTGILEPMAVFEKVSSVVKEPLNEGHDNEWFWNGEKIYYRKLRWDGAELEPKTPTCSIICTDTDGSKEELICEMEGWFIYHLFEGVDGQICVCAADWSGAEKNYCLLQIDEQGREIARFSLEGEDVAAAPGLACEDAAMDVSGNIATLGMEYSNGKIAGYILCFFKADEGYVGMKKLEYDSLKLLDLGEKGLYVFDNSLGLDRPFLARIDFDTMDLGEAKELPLKDIVESSWSYVILDDREKGILISESNALHRYDPDTGEVEKLLSWNAPEVNVNGLQIGQICFGDKVGTAEDGSVCQNLTALCNIRTKTEGKAELVRLEYVDQVYLPRRRKVVLGSGWKNPNIDDTVRRFNRSNTKYKVVLREYDNDTMLDELIRSKKDVPDILDLEVLDAQILAGKGLLEDLEPYFAESAVVKKEDILPTVWEAGILAGKMRECVISFYIVTMWCSDQGTIQGGWGAEEIAKLVRQYPTAPLVSYVSGDGQLCFWVSNLAVEQFLDLEAGTCSFDSPEFIALLEQLKEPAEILSRYTKKDDSSTEAFLDQEYLFYEGYYGGPTFFAYDWSMFSGKAANVGYPFSGEDRFLMRAGQRYGIFGLSERKDGAWAFLEFLLNEENQDWYEYGYQVFPVRRDSMEAYLKKPVSSNPAISNGFKKPSGTEKAFTEMLDHLRPDSRGSTSMIRKILSEEIPYCWDGDKSAKEVADIIQSRVRMYLNEVK